MVGAVVGVDDGGRAAAGGAAAGVVPVGKGRGACAAVARSSGGAIDSRGLDGELVDAADGADAVAVAAVTAAALSAADLTGATSVDGGAVGGANSPLRAEVASAGGAARRTSATGGSEANTTCDSSAPTPITAPSASSSRAAPTHSSIVRNRFSSLLVGPAASMAMFRAGCIDGARG